MQIITRTYTLDASGALTDTTHAVKGRLLSIHFRESPEAQADTIDFTITSVNTGQALLTVTNIASGTTWYPRIESEDNAGATNTFNATEPVYTEFVLFNEAIQTVVAQGTAGGRGTLYFAID